MQDIINRAEREHDLSFDEITALLKTSSFDAEILKAADGVRQKYVGDDVHLRALIEFSNSCGRNCQYCGLRRDNKNVDRYRLDADAIISYAKNARAMNYRTVVLQSGEDPFYTLEKMEKIITEIKKLDVAITLSIGEKTYEEYAAYKKWGADRYLLRIETTNKALYEKYDPGMSFENRIRCLNDLKSLGYELGTGSLVGLPEQTAEDLARDILFFKKIGADMIGLGPFIPNPDTPLKNETGGTFELAVKMMAIVRLLMPDINIPATTAMETLNKRGRLIALESGANVVMPNVTEAGYKKKYMLYPGKICIGESPEQCAGCITSKIAGIGRRISSDYGYRKKNFPQK